MPSPQFTQRNPSLNFAAALVAVPPLLTYALYYLWLTRVNGVPVLACQEIAKPQMRIEPLSPFPVLRDLVIDRSGTIWVTEFTRNPDGTGDEVPSRLLGFNPTTQKWEHVLDADPDNVEALLGAAELAERQAAERGAAEAPGSGAQATGGSHDSANAPVHG